MDHFQGFNIYNLGNEKPVKLKEMIETIGDLLDMEPKINQIPIPAGDVQGTYADITKSKKTLGYDPKVGLRQGIVQEIDWLRSFGNIDIFK